MKKLILFFTFLSTLSSFAQLYGNEWIDYSQNYYKIPISETGVYRISFQTLLAAGVPVTSVSPSNYQLFVKGEEVPIYIEGGTDGFFDVSDYIEFYGEKNDGWLDTAMYEDRLNQPNPYYSLINDTATYYLTISNSTSNLRYSTETANNFSAFTSSSSVRVEKIVSFSSNYYDGATILVRQLARNMYRQKAG